jgi:hypothetical protein
MPVCGMTLTALSATINLAGATNVAVPITAVTSVVTRASSGAGPHVAMPRVSNRRQVVNADGQMFGSADALAGSTRAKVRTSKLHCDSWQLYALALESPPLLIVSDIETIEIHTAFQNAVQDVHRIQLSELVKPGIRQVLRWAFTEPERLRPKRTRTQLTEVAAGRFADLATELRDAGHHPHIVAHFLSKLVFCMFAEDAGVLPGNVFTQLVEHAVERPTDAEAMLKQLFTAMRSGGAFGITRIEWFNGGLYDDEVTLPMTLGQLRTLRDLARMMWDQLEPSIFGTLFERGLDPDKRSQLGAHYTDAASIMRLVNPTIVEPLLEEWATVKLEIAANMERAMESIRWMESNADQKKWAMFALIQLKKLDSTTLSAAMD